MYSKKKSSFLTLFLLLISPLTWAQVTVYNQDFESLGQADPNALSNDGWLVFGNVFDGVSGNFLYGYGPNPAPNGGAAFSAVATGEGGAAQGAQQLVIYNDYNNGDHNNGHLIESNVFREQTIASQDVGKIFVFRYDAKKGDIAGATTARAYLQTLDPNNGFQQSTTAENDTTNLPTSWGTYTLELEITPNLVGHILQYGFRSTASNFEASGNFYDNISFDRKRTHAYMGRALYAAEIDQLRIRHLNPVDGDEGGQCSLSPGAGWDGLIGMSQHPITGLVYIAVDIVGGNPTLITLELRTCEQQVLTSLSGPVRSIEFDATGTLHATTSENEDTLVTVDLLTGTLNFVMNLPLPDGFGDQIAFNPNDGLMYHMAGEQGNGPTSFNAINLSTMSSNPITLSGDRPVGTEVQSIAWDPDSGYFVGNRAGVGSAAFEYFLVTTTGLQEFMSDAGGRRKGGMEFFDVDSILPDPAAMGDGRNLYTADSFGPFIAQVDPTTGDEVGLQMATLPGETIFGFNGLAYDPVDGELYAVARLAFGSGPRNIVKIDPSTGAVTYVGNSGERLAALAFDDAGTLYTASTENAIDNANRETLFTVDQSTGAITPFFAMSGLEFGEALAFNPNDDRMYRASGPVNIDVIDLGGGPSFSEVTYTGDIMSSDTVVSLAYDDQNDIFYGQKGTAGGATWFSVTPAGVMTNIATIRISKKGAAFVPEAPVSSNDVTTVIDVTGDAKPDVASLEGDQTVRPSVDIYSGADGSLFKTIYFINASWRGVGIGTVADADQNGTPDDPAAAVLAVNNSTGKIRVESRRVDNNSFLGSIQFFNENWRAVDVVIVDDLNGNGDTSDTAIGVLAERISDGRIQLQLRTFAGALVSNTVYLNARWTPVAAAVAARIDLPPFIGVIAEKPVDGRRVLQSRVAGTGAFDKNIKVLGSAWDYHDVSVNYDANGDGTPNDPVWVVLATRRADNVIRVQSRFVSDGSFDDNIVILSSAWEGFRMDVGLDMTMPGNLSNELVITAIRRSDARRRIHVKDYNTGATTLNIAP